MSKLLLTMFLSICIAVMLPTEIDADNYIPPVPRVLSVQETIVKYATFYGTSEKELLAVAKCESGFNPKAIGDGGRAANIFQYHKPTFISFSKLFGEQLDYHSYTDQARLTAFIWKHYPQYKNHWTCYTKIYRA